MGLMILSYYDTFEGVKMIDYKCPHCKKYFDIDITKIKYKCKRCGHKWTPRQNKEPDVCPTCKSPYWNQNYKRKPKTSKGNEG